MAPGNRQPGPSAGRGPADPGKRMVGRVLTGNGITAYGDGHDNLIGGDELSDGERDALLELCRQRLDAFREQRGEEVFAHRSGHRRPISGSVKVRVGFAVIRSSTAGSGSAQRDRRTSRYESSASTTWSNWSARAGMLSETICQMVSSSRPK
jgi:hypothetical protein